MFVYVLMLLSQHKKQHPTTKNLYKVFFYEKGKKKLRTKKYVISLMYFTTGSFRVSFYFQFFNVLIKRKGKWIFHHFHRFLLLLFYNLQKH